MAAYSTNPFICEFEVEDGEETPSAEVADDPRFSDQIPNQLPKITVGESDSNGDGITLDNIAARLIRDRYILTALELHMELMESGRELPRFREFFSNPGNFERGRIADTSTPSRLVRTSSIQTFDSLDFARYSDDGEKNESDKVAVLEFELRKAQETIKSLRAALTKTAETELSSPDTATEKPGNVSQDEPVRAYEKRAINFLLNEYLLKNNYKLTSVTFSEENDSQDFEDWDDVGINISKPPDLVHLYRDYGQHASILVGKQDFECMVSLDADINSNIEQFNAELAEKIAALDEKLEIKINENKLLAEHIETLELCSSNKELQSKLAIEITSESNSKQNDDIDVTPDRFEHVADDNDSKTFVDDSEYEKHTNSVHHESRADKMNKTAEPTNKALNSFQSALIATSFQIISSESRILSEVSKVFDSSHEEVVLMLGRCLPHIVPNILLAKRNELIPILICTATLHPDSGKRDELLNIVFNLIKRPDPEERNMILTGCVAFSQHAGPMQVETELLPHCWEQITHKYFERRLLVAEACGILSPYIPNEMRSSLVLSMLQQMLEDKLDEVREAVVKSLGLLVGFIDDSDKYQPIAQLLLTTLNDPSDRVVRAVEQVFLLSMAKWSMDLNCLEKHFVQMFIDALEKMIQVASNSSSLVVDHKRFALYVTILQRLLWFLFASAINSGPFSGETQLPSNVDSVIPSTTRLPICGYRLLDLSVILGPDKNVERLILLYDGFIAQEWHEMWPVYDWVSNELVPQLLNLSSRLDNSQPAVHCLTTFFSDLCRIFGRQFTLLRVRPRFEKVLKIPNDENSFDKLLLASQSPLNHSTVPIYVAGVLAAFGLEEDKKQTSTFLQELLSTLALHQSNLSGIQVAFTELCLEPSNHELLLRVLWDGVVHTSALIRSTSAKMFEFLIRGVSESLVGARVVPALVTLANDPEITVRTSTVSSFGTIMECVMDRSVLDKVHMQFQSFMDDPTYKDQHAMHLELIRTFGRIGPNIDPKFRDEFILPRLTAMTVQNQLTTNDTRKADVALQLFEAFSAISCCFISNQLIQEVMLPGLRCLHQDLQLVAPERTNVVFSMIREFEDKIDSNNIMNQSRSNSSISVIPPASVASSTQGEAVKSNLLKHFKDVKDRASQSNFSKIFTPTKK